MTGFIESTFYHIIELKTYILGNIALQNIKIKESIMLEMFRNNSGSREHVVTK